MATRKTKVMIQGISAEQANEAFAAYAEAAAREAKVVADMELQMTRIREKYAMELTRLRDAQQEMFDTLQAYASEHYAELFVQRKSVEMAHGVLGFRTGTPKLKTMRGITWASVLMMMREKEEMRKYIKVSEEIDKAQMLANRDEEGMAEKMRSVGVVVAQDETFFVAPKVEKV